MGLFSDAALRVFLKAEGFLPDTGPAHFPLFHFEQCLFHRFLLSERLFPGSQAAGQEKNSPIHPDRIATAHFFWHFSSDL